MAGHSQFKNIMHRKGRQDAARAKLFAKLAREITVSVRLEQDTATDAMIRFSVRDTGIGLTEELVGTEWLAAHLKDPALRIIESDEDVLLYDTGHNIPRNELIKETLNWLDQYLGPVN